MKSPNRVAKACKDGIILDLNTLQHTSTSSCTQVSVMARHRSASESRFRSATSAESVSNSARPRIWGFFWVGWVFNFTPFLFSVLPNNNKWLVVQRGSIDMSFPLFRGFSEIKPVKANWIFMPQPAIPRIPELLSRPSHRLHPKEVAKQLTLAICHL